MKKQGDISEIKAEVLLDYLYPELKNLWIVEDRGTFYRNYSEDLLSIDEDLKVVELARDGFLNLLPSGLLSENDELKGRNFELKYEELKRRQSLLLDLFKPIDTFLFRKKLNIESKVSQLLQEKLSFILGNYFHCNIEQETNKYVKKLMFLLPYVSRLRADFGFIRDLLTQLLGFQVEMYLGRDTWSDKIEYSLPLVSYQIIIPHLENEEFNLLKKELDPLCDFIEEWLIPFDTRCIIEIKYHDQALSLGNNLTLGYNTELNKEKLPTE